ncbi:hypothetical protein RD792_009724 [Penstemon davidsonii]|uniref:Uncharacterized protein n=1 Tax=Penstemon davidsonii TaxID=160366 RepID=A0ABR0D0M2_9LAMI|nr:hypothetical protein RD792_009724 [Penstemon davidsonii]
MVTDGSKNKTKLSAAPPHELNVRRFAESRASELESLHNIVSARLDNDFRCPRNKRKRTTGHDNRGSKKRFRKGDQSKRDSSTKGERKISRRVRRSIELKKNLPSGFGNSGDGTKRLRTHLWHAKRYTMTKLWGFHIPLGLHGRGRGSRAMLKKLKSGVLVHDASYCGTVQLEGPQDKLVSILSSVLVHSQSHCEAISHDILAGNIFGSAVLHSAGNPCCPSIAPVTYMWRPLRRTNTDTEGHDVHVSNDQQNFEESTFRQLWVWIHAAAFGEAYETLRRACEMEMDRSSGVAQCISLEGQLGKLELVGSKAFELLQKTLFPVRCISENYWHLKKCSADVHDDHTEPEKRCIINNFDQISSSAIIPVTVMDPRTSTKKGDFSAPEGNSLNLLGSEESETIEQTIPSLPKLETEGVADDSDLWDASKGLCSPLEESVVNMEKNHQRKDFIRLGPKTSGTQHASFDGKFSRSCPIFVLKNGDHEDSVIRYSIILPLSWVKVFWLNFISNGAHAIGLREMRWIACEIGLPYFPSDFPDSNAYFHTMTMEAAVSNQEAELRPPSKRPLEVPIPPPWNCVSLNFEKLSNKNSGSEKSETKLLECLDVQFEGFVARTSLMLNNFLNTTHLVLFPRTPDQKNSMYKLMKDEELLKQDTIIPDVKNKKAQCFVRVLLRAYKEGVFEQGAVVCAPHISDLKLWTRSESVDKQLQIPESSLQSYFLKVPSGKWELQIPEDPAVQDKKATAGAFCEATLLSKLRMEQWKALPVRQRRKEIYVLVRNMRSTAYRLALATIALEQVEEDVKFM